MIAFPPPQSDGIPQDERRSYPRSSPRMLPTPQRTSMVLILLLAVSAAYSNHFHNSFHFDDFHTVVNNPSIRSLGNLPRFFTDANTFSVLPTNRSWRPLVSASLAFDYWLGRGLNPVAFHAATFLLFLLQIVLLFFLFDRILNYARPSESNRLPALLAAGLYGLHPACAETVNYVIQRGDLYCTLGVVGGVYLFAARPEMRKYGLYLVPVAAAILAKPPALVFPVLLFLYLVLFEGGGWRRAAVAATPSLLVCVLLGTLEARMTPLTFRPGAYSASAYRITQPYVALRYFGTFWLPVHLSADTDQGALSNPASTQALAGYGFLALVLLTAIFCAKRREWKPVSFGLCWFLIALAPTSLFPLAEVENDHRMFFPFVGLALSVVWTAALARRRLPARVPALVPAALATAVCAAYAAGTYHRNEVWRTEETLWRDVAIKSPHNGRGLMNYGLTFLSKGDTQTALDYFNRALAYTPNYDVLEINLGIAYGVQHRDADAEQHFQRAIALAPQDARPAYYYARWLDQSGRRAEALIRVQTALALNPSDPDARALQAKLQAEPAAPAPKNPEEPGSAGYLEASLRAYQAGRYAEAIDAARAVLRLDPASAEAYNNLAVSYLGLRNFDEAERNIREALRIAPAYQLAKNNLAWIEKERAAPTPESYVNLSLQLCQTGKYRECIAAAQQALKLNPATAAAYNNIAVGYVSLGMPDEAIAAAQAALRLQPDFQLARNNLAWAVEEKRKREKALLNRNQR